MNALQTNQGLEGVVVADTQLSDVDGERGFLTIAGHDVEQLAMEATFEDVCGLLWAGSQDPNRADVVRLGKARLAAFEMLPTLGGALALADGMDALRAAAAHLPSSDERPETLVGALGVFAAAWSRTRAKLQPIAPDPEATHAADYLHMVRGERATPAEQRALDAYLVTVSDHGMNASTFTARVITSTGSDAVSAVVGAIGALKGPLHGGAPGPVLDMLDEIGTPDRATTWLEQELAAGRRIMGMGHRIYRVRDPRAAVFERALERFEHGSVQSSGRLGLARAVEQAAGGILRARYPKRPLHANVEFYTAVLLDTLRLPREAFTPTFAVGRVAGWMAHIAEQRRTGRLIRPASRYIGAPVERTGR